MQLMLFDSKLFQKVPGFIERKFHAGSYANSLLDGVGRSRKAREVFVAVKVSTASQEVSGATGEVTATAIAIATAGMKVRTEVEVGKAHAKSQSQPQPQGQAQQQPQQQEWLVGAVDYHFNYSAHRLPGLAKLAVAPDFRRKGVGEVLVTWCMRQAWQDGHSGISLHTTSLMPAAQALYERLGFVRDPAIDQTTSGIELGFVNAGVEVRGHTARFWLPE
jgi:GNAT superfamily N-acetyltransferase